MNSILSNLEKLNKITAELQTNYQEMLVNIQDLIINFPLNGPIFVKKENSIPTDFILSNSNLIPFYEKKLYNI